MRILHTFSNWKWTGPAEPALNLAWHQLDRHEVLFASGQAPPGEASRIEPQAERRGVPTFGGLRLGKHARLGANRHDARRLAALLTELRPDVIHVHMDNDHRVASLAAARTGIGLVVRTAYDAEGLSGSLRTRRVARRALDGLVVTSRGGLARTRERYGGGDDATIAVAGRTVPVALVEGGVDLARFDSSRFDRAAERARLGLAPDDVALGIVARVQSHRRFELLLAAHARVAARHPRLRLVVIGRGTKIESLLLEPVRALGLERSVIATGYLGDEAFPAALAALDGTLFLVPGSDGTCRALREQMAAGLPSIVTPRPPLPDLVADGVTGWVVEETVDGLAAGLERMVQDDERRRRMGAAALDAARRRFDLSAQARAVDALYERARRATAARRGAH